jgi:hypothetical protein
MLQQQQRVLDPPCVAQLHQLLLQGKRFVVSMRPR